MEGKLQINEEEAVAIRVILDQYLNTDIGANGVAKYLENHGIHKIQRLNGKNPLFDAHLARIIQKRPVYCGKIAYGRRKTEKITEHGTSIILWSRTITFWWTDSMKRSLLKMSGRQHR